MNSLNSMTGLKRILLVDDSPQDTELTLDSLEVHQLAGEVDAVRDGAEALDYLHRRGAFAPRPEGNPNLVLLDLKMPRVNGIEVLRQIRSDPKLKLIPVVIMTSSREEHDLQTCYHLRANAYVVKPVNFQAFVNAVQQVGVFWARINQAPPGGGSRAASGDGG